MKSKAFDTKEEQKQFEADIFDYTRNNVVSITVFIKDPFAEKILTSEKISPTSFMSDVGGLLGLFMGFSFVSGLEILYHALKVHFWKVSWPPYSNAIPHEMYPFRKLAFPKEQKKHNRFETSGGTSCSSTRSITGLT